MASIAHQVHRCLEQVTLNEDEIERLKTELGGRSVKQALRPGGNPTKPLPKIIGRGTQNTYFRTGRTFFDQAKELSGEKLLGRLLTVRSFSIPLITITPAVHRVLPTASRRP